MKISISHPTSNQNNRAVVLGMFKARILQEFHTAIAAFPGDFLDQLSTIDSFKEITRRHFEPELKRFTRTSPFTEIGRLTALKLGVKSLTRHEKGIFSIDAVYRNLDKKVATKMSRSTNNTINGIYAYEDGAFETFNKAKEHNLTCFYDLPIGYWRHARKLLGKEQERMPAWASTLTGFKDSEAKLQRKDNELALADHIFVASSFTAKSLADYPGKLAPIEVIPYGFPKPVESREYSMRNRALKLLFVGGLSQRKGIANMFAAVDKLLPHVELTVVGRKSTNDCNALNAALSKHQWIASLPHSEVLKLMQAHDVLLFPSLFEGFGLVITEAMSQGTPVITTDRTAGPDLIDHGHNGWLVEAGSTDAIQKCLEDILVNPEKIKEVGQAASNTAKGRPWEVYGIEIADAILKHYIR